jgi:hypothetical protein
LSAERLATATDKQRSALFDHDTAHTYNWAFRVFTRETHDLNGEAAEVTLGVLALRGAVDIHRRVI